MNPETRAPKPAIRRLPDIQFIWLVVFINCLVPLAILAWDALHWHLGANPLEYVTHTTGALTLFFLLLSLAVTPIRKLLGLGWMVKFRRTFGLFAFFYGCLHLMTYVWFDKFFSWTAIVRDVIKRPFIALGMFAFLLLVPLAITSTRKMIKRLGGKRWNLLHRIVYVAAVSGVLHYYLLVKADVRKPLLFAAGFGVVFLYRLVLHFLPERPLQRPMQRKSPQET